MAQFDSNLLFKGLSPSVLSLFICLNSLLQITLVLECRVEHSLDLGMHLLVDKRLLQLYEHVLKRGNLDKCFFTSIALDPTHSYCFISSGCQ